MKKPIRIKVFNRDVNEELSFDSINQAAKELKISKNTIRSIINGESSSEYKHYIFSVDEEVEDVSNVNDTNSYTFNEKNKTYEWQSSKTVNGSQIKTEYALELDVADQLFFEYSRYGLNLSALEVRINHNISIAKWNSLQHRLQLYKESDIFSPISRNNMSDDEYVAFVHLKLKEQQDYRRRAVVKQYNKFQVKEAEKLSKIAYNKRFVVDSILSDLSEWFSDRKSETVKLTINKAGTIDEVVIAVSDIHIGAEIERGYNNMTGYSSKIVRSILTKIASRINMLNAKKVTLLLGGDLIHSFTGTMHKTTFKEMEQKIYGSKLIQLAVDILEEFFGQIANLNKVLSIAGNHDRSADDYKSDTNGEISEIIMYILQRTYSELTIIHDPYLISSELNGIQHILLHGHTKSVASSESLIHDYGNPNLFNLILSGHTHSRKTFLDTVKSRHVTIPSIYTGDEFSIRAGYSTMPGFLIIQNVEGLPQITDASICI